MRYENAVKAAHILRDAGGKIVGRTRFQKVAYLLCVAGLEGQLSFSYKHYGPYSEDLATAVRDADLLSLLKKTDQQAGWGGTYSIYTTEATPNEGVPESRRQLASEAASADAVELELAATAVFLALEGYSDPWSETARRKPEKAENGRLDRAMTLYRKLSAIETPHSLPRLN